MQIVLRRLFFLCQVVYNKDAKGTQTEEKMANIYTESKQSYAQKAYERLCLTLQNMQWKFSRHDDRMEIVTNAIGKAMRIDLHFYVNSDRQLMYVKSPVHYKSDDAVGGKTILIGQAVNAANFSMLNGCFEYEEETGYLAYRMVIPFDGCELSEEVCRYLVLLTCQMVDKYNQAFADLYCDKISLQQFKQL